MPISFRRGLALSTSVIALAANGPAFAAAAEAAETSVSELIVTAQRRAEALQDVPIAVSSFTQQSLQAQHIDGGANLQQAVPNVTFSKGYYAGYNFQIRGIGTKQTSVTGDTSTGVHLNNIPLTENRLFEAEFFDVERVEVLRGPQGTLYGRNATGGVVNVITAKPTQDFAADVTAEIGSYDTRKLKAMVNLPIPGDIFALRLAGSYLQREGYGTNSLTNRSIDGRDLYSVRGTLSFEPTPTFRSQILLQYFREGDNRLNTSKSLCTRDPGPASVGGVAVTNAQVRGFLSQGCTNGSLYSDNAYGVPNSLATLYGIFAVRAGLANGDVLAGKTQSRDLSVTEAFTDPYYQTTETLASFSAEWDVTETLQFNVLSSYYKGTYDAAQDINGFQGSIPFLSTPLQPGGLVRDPQLGTSNLINLYNGNRHPARQWTHELRLQSDFKGPINFSLGGNYLDYETTQDNYTLSNAFTAYSSFVNGGTPCPINTATCIYIPPDSKPNPDGHSYFLSHGPYDLVSKAVFGEVYWEPTDTLKVTGGLRYTDDRKILSVFPAQLFVRGSGLVPGNPPALRAQFKEVTGRLGVDWQPDLAMTDKTLVYAFYSRGYKGGGPNNISPGARAFYDPEFVNSYEIGMKNTLLDGRMTLNLTGFYYDYKGYQISKIVNRVTTVENVDAEIMGAEFEGLWEPVERLKFNFALGLLDTKVKSGRSIDSVVLNQGNPNFTFAKTGSGGACLVPTTALGNLLAIIQQQPGAPTVAGVSGNPLAVLNACAGTYANLGVIPIDGIEADLKGKDLPNAPPWTLTLGAEYSVALSGSWDLTVRGDYFEQGRSFGRVFNADVDRIRGWKNANLSVAVSNPDQALKVELYVKNVLNDRPIVNTFLFDNALGLNQNVYILDPRLYGLSVSKKF